MDKLTAKKIENAKRVLKDGHCLWINCNECVANTNGCSVIVDSPEGRKFFEDKLKECGEYEQEQCTRPDVLDCHARNGTGGVCMNATTCKPILTTGGNQNA